MGLVERMWVAGSLGGVGGGSGAWAKGRAMVRCRV
jgi:hypothetical protein